jgi:uncharacterized protein YegJ (DUF2314 family)
MAKFETVQAQGNDPALAIAGRQARAHFKFFWRELSWEYRRIIPALEMTAVKAAFAEPGIDPEHMWVTDLSFDGEHLTGSLLNEPHSLTSIKAGDPVRLTFEEVEDWMYVVEGKAYGAWSVQTLRARMEVDERARHDELWGLDFGAPESVRLAEWDRDGTEHPMSESMARGLGDAVDRNREAFLSSADEAGLTTLHSLALAGSEACVRTLLSKGADRSQRTKAGKTALDLAATMGWPRVIDLLK